MDWACDPSKPHAKFVVYLVWQLYERGHVQICMEANINISVILYYLCVKQHCAGKFIQRHHSLHYDTSLLHPASPYVASSLGVSHTS